ncbi:hypothetical protein ACH4OT_02185 [Streptomyces murinus]|uniref:hypothetical protein n=1 Tax=Streptomyces murinus TaxID=33900 RepID=UPI0037B51DA0
MTDLPYLDRTRPVIAMIGPPEHIALLSLPMLSLMRAAHRLRGAALGVIGALMESGNTLPSGRSVHQRGTARPRAVVAARRDGPRQPALAVLFTGLSRALAGVFVPAAFTLYAGQLRDAVFALLWIHARPTTRPVGRLGLAGQYREANWVRHAHAFACVRAPRRPG